MAPPADTLPIVYLDGAYVPAEEARVSVFDRGFLYADGVFETLHVQEGAPLALREHRERLEESAAFLDIDLPSDVAELPAVLAGLLRRNGLGAPEEGEIALRITLTRGAAIDGPPTLCIFGRRLHAERVAGRHEGVRLHRLPLSGRGPPELAMHKTLSYLASALGQLRLDERLRDPRSEGVFVDEADRVLEGTRSNVFVVEAGRLTTPPIDMGILPGTARRIVLEQAAEAGYEVAHEPVSVERVRRADEVLVTASTLHVTVAHSLDGQPIGTGLDGPVFRELRRRYEARVARDIRAWHGRPEAA